MPVTAPDIAKRMAILIAAGEWQAGEELPGMRDMTLSWRISMETATEAMALLKDGGLAADGPGGAAVVTSAGRHIAELMVRENGQG
jgi:DNA-binding transcriptional regulator YhcF (GntR family)